MIKMKFKKLNESNENTITVFMNTWDNYNESGADSTITPTGWMSVDEALKYCEKYAEHEPFINDIDNPTDFDLDINEYGNAVQDLETIQTINNMNDYDKKALSAIWSYEGGSFDDSLEIFESGDFQFIPDISDYKDLAYEYIDELGGIGSAVSDPSNYIDEDEMRRDYEYDIKDMMWEDAPAQIAREEGIDEDEVTEDQIEDWIDENIDSYLDSIIEEEILLAEQGEVDLSNYFDYEKFGRALSDDGWSIESTGAVIVY